MKILGIITIVFTLIYTFINRQLPLILNLSNGFFIIGLIYFLIALAFYVRNVGFFKLISYHRYRRRQIKGTKGKTIDEKMNSDYAHNEDIMEFHEFCNEHYKDQWSNKVFFIYAIPLLIISYILAYFV